MMLIWKNLCIFAAQMLYTARKLTYSKLSAKENEAIMVALDKNWDFINEQIDKTFSGIKTESKRIK